MIILGIPLLGAILKRAMFFQDDGGDGGGDGGDGGDGGSGSGGVALKDWKATLPPEIKDHPSLAAINTPADMAKSYIHGQSLIGREKIPVPPKDGATPEDWGLVFDRLGRPSSADGYVIPNDIQIPEGMPFDTEVVKAFTAKAHEIGLLPQQVDAIYRWYMDNNINSFAQMLAARDEAKTKAETDMRMKLGKAFNEKMALTQKVVAKFAGDEQTLSFFEEHGNDPRLINFVMAIGEKFGEDVLSGIPKGLTKTPEEAQAEINKIMANKTHPYWDEKSPEHAEAVRYMEALHNMLHPEGV